MMKKIKKICLIGHADDRAKAVDLLAKKKVIISHVSCISRMCDGDARAIFMKHFYDDIIVTRKDLVGELEAIHPGLLSRIILFHDLPKHLAAL